MSRSGPNGRTQVELVEKDLSYAIVGCFYETYNELGGYGHSEVTYRNSLEIALVEKGIKVEREHVVDVFFRDRRVGHHRLDRILSPARLRRNPLNSSNS